MVEKGASQLKRSFFIIEDDGKRTFCFDAID
jgi:hypothetical protein